MAIAPAPAPFAHMHLPAPPPPPPPLLPPPPVSPPQLPRKRVQAGVRIGRAAFVDYYKRMLPPEWATTGQQMLLAIQQNVGGGLGAVLGGYLMTRHGGRWLYRAASAAGATTFALHFASCLLLHACGGTRLMDIAPAPSATVEPLVAPAALPSGEADEAVIVKDVDAFGRRDLQHESSTVGPSSPHRDQPPAPA